MPKTRKRRKQLLGELKERRKCWKLKEEALDCTVWRTGFGRGTTDYGVNEINGQMGGGGGLDSRSQEHGPVESSCEYGTEPSNSIKTREFFE
jgi:hypothetical protein